MSLCHLLSLRCILIYTSSFQLVQDCVIQLLYSVVVSIFFNFHPYLGKLPNLTNIFQLGWNHQPVLPCMSELTSISCCTMSQLGCFRKVPHPFGRSFAEENPRKLWAHFRRKQNPWRWLPCFTYGGPVVSWSSTTCTPAPPPSTKTAIPEGSWGEGRVSKFKQDFRGNKKCIGGRELV